MLDAAQGTQERCAWGPLLRGLPLGTEEFPNQAKRRLVGPVPPLNAGTPIGHQADWARTPAKGASGWGGPAALPPVAPSPQSLAAGLKPRRQAGGPDQESGGANVR